MQSSAPLITQMLIKGKRAPHRRQTPRLGAFLGLLWGCAAPQDARNARQQRPAALEQPAAAACASAAAAAALPLLEPAATCNPAALLPCRPAGIRSFSPDNQNVIEFYKPLTLIVGHNGAGKTVRDGGREYNDGVLHF